MPPLELLNGQPAAMVLALVLLFLLNRQYTDHLKEKREIIEIIRAERAEWIKKEEQMQGHLLELVRTSTEGQTRTVNELHQLRNWITKWTLEIERVRLGGKEPPPRAPFSGDQPHE